MTPLQKLTKAYQNDVKSGERKALLSIGEHDGYIVVVWVDTDDVKVETKFHLDGSFSSFKTIR